MQVTGHRRSVLKAFRELACPATFEEVASLCVGMSQSQIRTGIRGLVENKLLAPVGTRIVGQHKSRATTYKPTMAGNDVDLGGADEVDAQMRANPFHNLETVWGSPVKPPQAGKVVYTQDMSKETVSAPSPSDVYQGAASYRGMSSLMVNR